MVVFDHVLLLNATFGDACSVVAQSWHHPCRGGLECARCSDFAKRSHKGVTIAFDRPMRYGQGALSLAYVVVPEARLGRALIPPPRNSYLVGYRVQFIWSVGQHVAHDHPSESVCRNVNVDAH